jgi:hypothetical protein
LHSPWCCHGVLLLLLLLAWCCPCASNVWAFGADLVELRDHQLAGLLQVVQVREGLESDVWCNVQAGWARRVQALQQLHNKMRQHQHSNIQHHTMGQSSGYTGCKEKHSLQHSFLLSNIYVCNCTQPVANQIGAQAAAGSCPRYAIIAAQQQILNCNCI